MLQLVNKKGRILNISPTLDGLKMTTNGVGRSLYYRDGILKTDGKRVWFEGDLQPSPNIEVIPWTGTLVYGDSTASLWNRKAQVLNTMRN